MVRRKIMVFKLKGLAELAGGSTREGFFSERVVFPTAAVVGKTDIALVRRVVVREIAGVGEGQLLR